MCFETAPQDLPEVGFSSVGWAISAPLALSSPLNCLLDPPLSLSLSKLLSSRALGSIWYPPVWYRSRWGQGNWSVCSLHAATDAWNKRFLFTIALACNLLPFHSSFSFSPNKLSLALSSHQLNVTVSGAILQLPSLQLNATVLESVWRKFSLDIMGTQYLSTVGWDRQISQPSPNQSNNL